MNLDAIQVILGTAVARLRRDRAQLERWLIEARLRPQLAGAERRPVANGRTIEVFVSLHHLDLHLPDDLGSRGGVGTAQRDFPNTFVFEVSDVPFPNVEVREKARARELAAVLR